MNGWRIILAKRNGKKESNGESTKKDTKIEEFLDELNSKLSTAEEYVSDLPKDYDLPKM